MDITVWFKIDDDKITQHLFHIISGFGIEASVAKYKEAICVKGSSFASVIVSPLIDKYSLEDFMAEEPEPAVTCYYAG